MRLLSILCLSSTLAGDASAQAKTVVKAFRITDSLRIDAKKEDLARDPVVALRADGTIAIVARGPRLAYFDSLGRKRWIRELREDITIPNALGWIGDSLFVVDNYTHQVLMVGSNGGVGRLSEMPDLIRPKWKDRITMSAYASLDVVVATPDSLLIGTPRRPRKLGFYGVEDRLRLPVVAVDQDGVVQRRLATVSVGPKGDSFFVLSDGRVVILRKGADSTAFIAISARGDTLFSRMLAKAKGIYGAVGGPDGTIWVSTGARGYDISHTAYDAKGVATGSLDLSNAFRVVAGDARHVWAIQTLGANRPLWRYTVKP